MMFVRPKELKFKLNIPYLTGTERIAFKAMVESGAETIFGIATCEGSGCEEDVPRDKKRFCSVGCFKREEGAEDAEESKEEEAWPVD